MFCLNRIIRHQTIGIRIQNHSRKTYKNAGNGPAPYRLSTRTANFFFKEHLIYTNCISSGAFLFLGDLFNQEVEFRSKLLPERYDWARLGRMFLVGTLMGPLHHIYYTKLDKLLPKSDFRTATIKVASDQLVCGPLTILFFFYATGILEKKTHTECTREISAKFLYVYLGDWLFWPPVQYINFCYLESRYRVFFINFATMVYDIFLSYMKHDYSIQH